MVPDVSGGSLHGIRPFSSAAAGVVIPDTQDVTGNKQQLSTHETKYDPAQDAVVNNEAMKVVEKKNDGFFSIFYVGAGVVLVAVAATVIRRRRREVGTYELIR